MKDVPEEPGSLPGEVLAKSPPMVFRPLEGCPDDPWEEVDGTVSDVDEGPGDWEFFFKWS